jgi:UDP-N-acetylmuramoyl-L-alanyl-D-glutamate--2,6-diaminopimelate ligase
VDRRTAIHKAVEMASPDDVVLIAGKGHETYQLIGKTVHEFDDRIVAKEAIRGLSK